MQRKMNAIVALVVVAVIVLAVNLIGSLLFNRVKLDITQEKLYTLSEGSRNTLKGIDATVTAKFFYSRTALTSVPFLRDYANRVEELLREYLAYSGGKMKLEIIDPRPDTDEEEIAEKAGIQGVPISEETGTVYLGLQISDENGEVISIPFFDPRRESSLEYEITKALYTVTHPEKKKVGVISSLPVMGGGSPQNPMMMQRQQQDRPWVFVN
ncbi:MAG TPA: GldG family protein, partial [Candidatus Sumerlaeota bacterium]|nr:GldG family protein [Candidatus Sumerlaeota bacterium]